MPETKIQILIFLIPVLLMAIKIFPLFERCMRFWISGSSKNLTLLPSLNIILWLLAGSSIYEALVR